MFTRLTFTPVLLGAALLSVPAMAEPPRAEPELAATYNPMQGFAPLVDAVSPAVVSIETEGMVSIDTEIPDFFREFIDPEMLGPRPQQGQGSGFVVSEDGLVLTNHHVIDEADIIKVKFSDGREVQARVLGSDASIDVALLQLPADEAWPHVELGNSDKVRVGDWALAIGNPLGLGHTVTAGIISGKGRVVDRGSAFDDYLQTDAAINPGNSGGPLFTLDGQVMGMNTAIIAGANTVGFAVPSNMIRAVIDDLKNDGRVSRGFIGISTQPVTQDLATAMNLPSAQGVLVAEVHEGAPAKKAGLREGDVIIAVDDVDTPEPLALIKEVSGHRPGEKLELTYLREGKQRTATATLIERPDTVSATDRREVPDAGTDEADDELTTLSELGLELDSLPEAMAEEVGIRGVIVESIRRDSPAAGALRAGDILLQVNQKDVTSPAEVDRILRRSGDSAFFLVIRGDAQRFVVVDLDE